jgi:hypothetical protein
VARLSKTRYVAGLQCPKRLWLLAHGSAAAAPPDPATEAILALGSRIGVRAHALFPGGVLVPEASRRSDEALAETRALLADRSVPAIFEGVFEHAGVRVHVDVLERLADGGFGLREVKAATSVRPHHYHDVALQRFVLEGAGLRVPSAQLVHVDRDYVRGPGGVDVARLFRREELAGSKGLREAAERIPAAVAAQHGLLACERAPEVAPGRQCHDPVGCEFWAHCTAGKPEDWVYLLPRAGERLERLLELGVERIAEIPEDFPLSELQGRVREAHRTGAPFVAPGLAGALAELGPPALYLDFEAIAPAEPLYTRTRPYEAIPFQWSLHRVEAGGAETHRGLLADGREDPRRALAEGLIDAAGAGGEPILVWSSFEATVLGALAGALPDLAAPLAALRCRLRDLAAATRRFVYHPGFAGSFSIKAVAPALAPGFGWGDLAEATGIADGATAAAAFERIAAGEGSALEEARVRAALWAYCRRDTEALVAVHRALRALGDDADR